MPTCRGACSASALPDKHTFSHVRRRQVASKKRRQAGRTPKQSRPGVECGDLSPLRLDLNLGRRCLILVSMKFAICNEIFKDWKMEEAMACAAKAGYDAIEIAPFTIANLVTDISPARRQEIRQAAERAGLAISGIHWVLVQAEGMYLNHPDKGIRDRTAKYFCDLVDFCTDLGGHIIVVGSPKQRNILEGVTPE